MQLIIEILIDFVLYLVITYSFSICYRTMRFINLAHAISLTLAAYMVYTFSSLLSLPFWLSIVLSISVVLILMVLVNGIIYRPGRKSGLEGWQLMIVSLGLYIVFQNVISIVWKDATLSFRTWEIRQGHPLLDGSITDVQIVTLAVSTLLLIATWLFQEKAFTGLRMKAVSMNPELGSIVGMDKEKMTAISIALGSTLMACSGILIAADVDMNPTMGFDWLLYGIVTMIIAGTGRIRYMVFGALLLAAAQHLTAHFLGNQWMNATAYVILIVFLYLRPYGFSGQRIKKTEV